MVYSTGCPRKIDTIRIGRFFSRGRTKAKKLMPKRRLMFWLHKIHMRKMFMLFYKDLINEHLSQDFSVLCPLVLTIQCIHAAVYCIDLSGTPCIRRFTFHYLKS